MSSSLISVWAGTVSPENPPDAAFERSAAKGLDGAVERLVAGQRRHVVHVHVRSPKGGEDAGHHQIGADLRCRRPCLGYQRAQLVFHPVQAVPLERNGIEVDLEVEERELGREVGIVDALQEVEGRGVRMSRLIRQEQLLLGSDAADIGFEQSLIQPVLQGIEVVRQPLVEVPELPSLQPFADIMLPHVSSPQSRELIRRLRG